MSKNKSSSVHPAGYEALIAKHGLSAIRHWHRSSVGESTVHQAHRLADQVSEVYPRALMPKNTLGGQIEFALKYDGTNLEILCALFDCIPADEWVAYIQSKPMGKYARRIWYLYELITGKRLPLNDLTSGNYVDLLEPEEYYTATPIQMRRQRINDNLLGDARFSPIVRRTELLRSFESKDLSGKCRDVLAAYPREVLKRALSYLYTKETKSSFEIENVTLDTSRAQRFVALLVMAGKKDFFSKKDLIELQSRITDERFHDADYRKTQNYVGEAVAWGQEHVHYISPKPGNLNELMEGMYVAHDRMSDDQVSPVIHAAVIAFGFVYMHPFEDGNGRIHRFLIHNILARRNFTPPGAIFPVSAVMLREMEAYDSALEAFSKELLPSIQYELDPEGRLSVQNDTVRHYRFIDMTRQTEALFGFIERVIETDLVAELKFLQNYDATKEALQEIVDMPDRLIDLFIKTCIQNNCVLSAAKRKKLFEKLTDDEIARMQAAVQMNYRAEKTES